MREIIRRNRYDRDVKRIVKRGKSIEKLLRTIRLLAQGTELPETARPHKLSGEYAGLWECHVESDWLLIYNSTDTAVILARTGTHADLFE